MVSLMKPDSSLHEAKFLAATAVFTLALLVFSLKGILTPPETGLPSGTGERGPASEVAGAQAGLNGGTGELETLEWDCRDAKDVPTVKGSHVRLKSKYCDKSEKPEVRIVNTANGYTASVFLAAKGFSTDFIDLREGLNEISIEWKSPKGEPIRRAFHVRREPAVAPTGAQE
ncbi:MAG: hypothetical protein KF767_10185 [Bdellovibrionaceae bacterium]|nr:hypothetical protein [Pseudobdellovibrionaceae bacterium]